MSLNRNGIIFNERYLYSKRDGIFISFAILFLYFNLTVFLKIFWSSASLDNFCGFHYNKNIIFFFFHFLIYNFVSFFYFLFLFLLFSTPPRFLLSLSLGFRFLLFNFSRSTSSSSFYFTFLKFSSFFASSLTRI